MCQVVQGWEGKFRERDGVPREIWVMGILGRELRA